VVALRREAFRFSAQSSDDALADYFRRMFFGTQTMDACSLVHQDERGGVEGSSV